MCGAARWYLRYPKYYQDVVDLLAERDVADDRSTVFRWRKSSVPNGPSGPKNIYGGPALIGLSPLGRFVSQIACRAMDETYICVGGKWRHLWRAVDADGTLSGHCQAMPCQAADGRFPTDGATGCQSRQGLS